MRERSVEKIIGDFCKSRGISYQKQNGHGDRGKADRLLMRHGKAAFIEVKKPGGKPTALQFRYLQERQLDGFDAEWRDVCILTVEGDRIRLGEVFDESDLDAALARFDELSQQPPT